MKLSEIFKPICAKCPYTLGLVKFAVCPCPHCKKTNYSIYRKLISGRYEFSKTKEENYIKE